MRRINHPIGYFVHSLYQTIGSAKIHGMMMCSSHGRGVRLKGYHGYQVLSDCCKLMSINRPPNNL